MGECRPPGASAEEPRPKSLTTRSSPDQRRRPHPSTGCGLLVRKPQFEVNNQGSIISQLVVEKDWELTRQEGLTAVPHDRREKPSLDADDLVTLASLGARIADIFGCPQDVEWVIDHQGNVWIVQSRPITAI